MYFIRVRLRSLRRVTLRVLLLALLWLILTGGDTDNLWLGALAILGGALVSLALLPDGGWRWTPSGIVRFLPFFLWQSLVGGMDVALRALRPDPPLNPDILEYEFRLPESPARVFMADAVSLLPGTLSTEIEGGHLRVHALSGPEALETLRELESKTAGLFGLELARKPRTRIEHE